MTEPPDAERRPVAGAPTEGLNQSTEPATNSNSGHRYSDDPDRDWIIRALRGEIKTEGSYYMVRVTRELWQRGWLHDRPEIVAHLCIGDNAHSDDADRFAEFDRPWEFEPSQRSPETEAAFDALVEGWSP